MISPANLAILALNILPATLAVPLASPEVAGAGGECMKPTIKVNSVNKVKLGPFLTTGVSSEAAPGGVASFTNTYSIAKTVDWGGSVGPTLAKDITKVWNLALAFAPSYSVSTTVGSSTGTNTGCPQNTSGFNITWGLMQYVYNYNTTGTKTYGGYNPLMRDCDEDEIAHKDGGTFDFAISLPATQGGSSNGADTEVEFACCTNQETVNLPGSAVCPTYD